MITIEADLRLNRYVYVYLQASKESPVRRKTLCIQAAPAYLKQRVEKAMDLPLVELQRNGPGNIVDLWQGAFGSKLIGCFSYRSQGRKANCGRFDWRLSSI